MGNRWLKHVGVLLLTGGLMSAATAWAQTPRPEPPAQPAQCNATVLTSADNKYEFGFFDDTIAVLRPCLSKSSATVKQRVPALRLAALSYFEIDQPETAKELIRSLLEAKRNYNPPDGDPQYFHHSIDELRPTQFFRKREFLLAAAASAITLGISYVLFKPSSTPTDPLPGPPSLPPGGN